MALWCSNIAPLKELPNGCSQCFESGIQDFDFSGCDVMCRGKCVVCGGVVSSETIKEEKT